MKVLIIEDEPQAAERLSKVVMRLRPQAEVVARIDSIKKSIEWLKAGNSPDLIFVDIQLADGLSFEIFERVEVTPPVIFTTAFNEYALKAFKVNSIDYILKPIDEAELESALKKFENLTQRTQPPARMLESIGYAMQMLTKKYKERFVIKVGEHLKSIEVNEVLFFFSLEKATFAQTKDGRKHILDFTMDQLEGLVDPSKYFRINRKYLVSVAAIQDMISYSNSRLRLALLTSDDDDVVVARERVQDFKEWLDR